MLASCNARQLRFAFHVFPTLATTRKLCNTSHTRRHLAVTIRKSRLGWMPAFDRRRRQTCWHFYIPIKLYNMLKTGFNYAVSFIGKTIRMWSHQSQIIKCSLPRQTTRISNCDNISYPKQRFFYSVQIIRNYPFRTCKPQQ
jgi:hypothetical protein